MTKFVTLLKDRKLTVTPQRIEIVNILSTNRHINVDKLYSLLLSSFPSISLATVYKNINIMLEKSLISEVQIPNKKSVYELIKEEHFHVTCKECNEVLDLNLDVSKLVDEAKSKSGYDLKSSTMVFSGLCPKCVTA